MKIGSLFSGIGGLELGLERAGVGRTVWQVEQSEFCRQVLAKHWPDAVRYEDVTTTDWSSVEPVDVICGGFPCPPFSSAGKRQGVLDERWLWPAFAYCVAVVRPRYVVVENVADITTFPDAWGAVLGDLHQLGFDAEWSLLSACRVGAPHRRRRVFLLAYPPADHEQDHLSRRPLATVRSEPRGGGGRARADGWLPEPALDRVAHGVPSRVVRDPLGALGNAVVPQVAEVVGRRLLAHIESERKAAS